MARRRAEKQNGRPSQIARSLNFSSA